MVKIPSFLHEIPFPVYRSLADCILGRAGPIWFPGGDKFTPWSGVDALSQRWEHHNTTLACSELPLTITCWINSSTVRISKTSQECKTALTSQYQTLFFVFFVFLSFCLFVFLSFCLFVFLSFCLFCLFVFLSGHYSDQMTEGSQVLKVTLCVKILTWRSLTWPSDQG